MPRFLFRKVNDAFFKIVCITVDSVLMIRCAQKLGKVQVKHIRNNILGSQAKVINKSNNTFVLKVF